MFHFPRVPFLPPSCPTSEPPSQTRSQLSAAAGKYPPPPTRASRRGEKLLCEAAGDHTAIALPCATLAWTRKAPGACLAVWCPRRGRLPPGGGAAPCWPRLRSGSGAGVLQLWPVTSLPVGFDSPALRFLRPHFSWATEQEQRSFRRPQVSRVFPRTVWALRQPAGAYWEIEEAAGFSEGAALAPCTRPGDWEFHKVQGPPSVW